MILAASFRAVLMVDVTVSPVNYACLLGFDESFVSFVTRQFVQDSSKKIVRILSKVDLLVGHLEEKANKDPSQERTITCVLIHMINDVRRGKGQFGIFEEDLKESIHDLVPEPVGAYFVGKYP